MKANFFGSSGLFGAYHPPKGSRELNKGVVLCYPLGQEYSRSHWAFLHLAKMLNKIGYHVFRFDYYGTGDSMGETMSRGTEQWINDIQIAIDELIHISRVDDISLVGLRLGATLAAFAQQSSDVKKLVLWSPVTDGDKYVGNLASMQREMVKSQDYFLVSRTAALATDPEQLLGFPMPGDVRVSIENLNILRAIIRPTTKTYLIIPEASKHYSGLLADLDRGGVKVDCRIVPDAGEWDAIEQFEAVLTPFLTLQTITSILHGE